MNDNIIDHLPDSNKFLDERTTSRIVFLRKLYALLAFQYVVATVALRFITWEDAQTLKADGTAEESIYTWIKTNNGLGIGLGVALIVVAVVVYFKRSWFRKTPINAIVYIVFTLLLAYTLVFLSDAKRILALFVVSVLVLCISLLFYALTTRLDLTFLGGTIYIIGSALFSYLAFLIVTDVAFFNLILLGLGIVVIGFYLIYDTKFLIVGQSSSSQTEDAFVGSIVIYLDVIFIGFRLIESFGKLFKRNRF